MKTSLSCSRYGFIFGTAWHPPVIEYAFILWLSSVSASFSPSAITTLSPGTLSTQAGHRYPDFAPNTDLTFGDLDSTYVLMSTIASPIVIGNEMPDPILPASDLISAHFSMPNLVSKSNCSFLISRTFSFFQSPIVAVELVTALITSIADLSSVLK